MACGISKSEDSTTSLGSLCQCLVTPHSKNVSWCSEVTPCLYPLPLILSKDLWFFVQFSNFLPVLTLLGDNRHLRLLNNKCRVPVSGFYRNKTVFGRKTENPTWDWKYTGNGICISRQTTNSINKLQGILQIFYPTLVYWHRLTCFWKKPTKQRWIKEPFLYLLLLYSWRAGTQTWLFVLSLHNWTYRWCCTIRIYFSFIVPQNAVNSMYSIPYFSRSHYYLQDKTILPTQCEIAF